MDPHDNERTDEELMALYQGGDAGAFEALFRRHSGRVLGFLEKRTEPQAARELLQEVFLKLHRFRHQYAPQYPFLPWLFTLTRNVLIDALRRERPQAVHELEIVDSAQPTALDLLSGPDLSQALLALPERQKQAIELRYLRDWTFEQIASEMKTSPMNVRQIISRGIRALRTGFGGSHE